MDIPHLARSIDGLKVFGVLTALLCAPAAAHAQGAMTNGAIHTAAISAPGELDQWTFTASQGDAITIAIGETGSDIAFYPWIRLQGPNGAQIGNSWGAVAAQISLYAPESGTYTLIAASNDSGFNDTGSYRLTLAHTPGAFVVSGGDQGGAIPTAPITRARSSPATSTCGASTPCRALQSPCASARSAPTRRSIRGFASAARTATS